MSVLFHGAFPLHRERMAKLIAAAFKNPKANDKQLAEPFGYGAPIAARYRSWIHKTGLAEMGLPMVLTPLGNVVIKKDSKLESPVSQWFLHHELVTDLERSEAWHYFALEFLPKHASFTEGELLDGLTEKLRSHSEMHFGPGSKLNRQILRKIIQVYTEDSGLGLLGLIRKDGKQIVRGSNVKVLGPWTSPENLEKAYK